MATAPGGHLLIANLLIQWTIRLSLVCYAVALASWLTASDKDRLDRRWIRAIWTLGLLLLLAHIVAVFHFVHDWRHELAVEHTARATRAVVGREFGAGVYFNYLFAAVWSADVAWWWLAPQSRERRSRVLTALLHSYLLFIVVNSVIVFEDGMLRWCGVVAALVLILLAVRRVRGPR